jgi:ribosomal protein S18 acetylase RimI-like enzyme
MTGVLVDIERFAARHLDGILALCNAEQWPDLPADPPRAQRVLRAPNAVTLVALDNDEVIGIAAAISDGAIDAYLSMLVVAAAHRRQGIAAQLIAEMFRATGVGRIDLLAEPGSEGFYDTMPHRELRGYRLYAPPEA